MKWESHIPDVLMRKGKKLAGSMESKPFGKSLNSMSSKILRKKWLIFFSFFLVLFWFTFRNLLSNLSSNLIDWRDYALENWIVFQNISHFRSPNITNFFDSNAFYPCLCRNERAMFMLFSPPSKARVLERRAHMNQVHV